MRAAFVAIGLALLACLLAFGMHSLAAGPGALPQKMDVAAPVSYTNLTMPTTPYV